MERAAAYRGELFEAIKSGPAASALTKQSFSWAHLHQNHFRLNILFTIFKKIDQNFCIATFKKTRKTTYSVRIQTLENKWAPGSTGGPEFERGESRIFAHTFFLTNHRRGNDSVHNKHRTSAFITSLWLVRLNDAFFPCETPQEAWQHWAMANTHLILGSEFLYNTR